MMVPDGKEHFTVNVLVAVSPTFFAWLTNFGNNIEIVNPPIVRKQFGDYVNDIAILYK